MGIQGNFEKKFLNGGCYGGEILSIENHGSWEEHPK